MDYGLCGVDGVQVLVRGTYRGHRGNWDIRNILSSGLGFSCFSLVYISIQKYVCS